MSATDNSEQFTGLILVSGVDKPGITQALFNALAPFSIIVLDIEQVVIKARLILTVLISLNPAHQAAIEIDLNQCAADLDVDLAMDFSNTHSDSIASKSDLVHVVILSKKLNPRAISTLATSIAELGGNIERISRLASTPILALELIVSRVEQSQLSQALSPLASAAEIDIAVSPSGLFRHARKLVQLDVDSTLISQEVIDILAEKAGVGDQVKLITESAMRGELDFESSLRARVALLKDLPESFIALVQQEISLTPGARTLVTTLQKLGHTVSVVSGGFIDVIAPILMDLNIQHFKANKLVIKDGVLTGEVSGAVIDRPAKAVALKEFAAIEAISMKHTIAIGDGANDLDMIAAAGLGIAFNAKPHVKAAADSTVSNPYLDSVLYLLGISPEEVLGDIN
jgi:phosphoserine phosphatase